MNKIADVVVRGVEFLLVICVAAMAIMVFGNVVLRYAFNSGITISEEASRMAFIWLVFLGGILAMREKVHVGVDVVVKQLPVWGKKICAVLSDVLILGCCVLLFIGSWKQTAINLTVKAPVTEVPMAIIYAAGLVASVMIGGIVLVGLIKVLRGRVSEEELISVKETLDRVDKDAA